MYFTGSDKYEGNLRWRFKAWRSVERQRLETCNLLLGGPQFQRSFAQVNDYLSEHGRFRTNVESEVFM